MTRLILVVLMLLLSSVSFAKIYKWVDAHGEVHYQDHPRGTPEEIYNGGASNSAAQNRGRHTVTRQHETQKQTNTIKKSRDRRDKAADRALAAQRKQAEQCNKIRGQVDRLEAKLKEYGRSGNEHPTNYLHQQKLLIQRQRYLDRHCN